MIDYKLILGLVDIHLVPFSPSTFFVADVVKCHPIVKPKWVSFVLVGNDFQLCVGNLFGVDDDGLYKVEKSFFLH